MKQVIYDGKVGGFLNLYGSLVFELDYVPSKIFVEAVLGKLNFFVLGKDYPRLVEEDARILNYQNGIKYHLPKGGFQLDRYFMFGKVEAVAIQGLDLINLFWLEVL